MGRAAPRVRDPLAERPEAAHAIEMEDVRHLVCHEETHPVLMRPQRELLHGRSGVEHDPVRREGRGRAVRVIHVVGEDEIDTPAGGRQLARQGDVCGLGDIHDAPGERLEPGLEDHAHVRGLERLPRQVGAHGGLRRGDRRHRDASNGEESAHRPQHRR